MFSCWTRRAVVILAVAGVALASSACDDVKDLYQFDSTPVTYTETFAGSLTTGGVSIHPFVVTVSGTVTLKLTAVTPDAAQVLGFDIGTWDGTNCNPIFGSGSRSATQGYSFQGSAIVANFCARIHDGENRIPADTTVNYTIQVDHP